MNGLRLLVYDRTCRGKGPLPGLSHAWSSGARLYQTFGHLDAAFPASDWEAALEWLAQYETDRPIDEIQFWGHGRWGSARIDGVALDRSALRLGHAWAPKLHEVRARMHASSVWWFRTCETFGAEPGHDFARAWTDYFGCRAAGHTYIIGYWQSGLHTLAPGASPDWDSNEGLLEGTPAQPQKAAWSTPTSPNTITCFTSLAGRSVFRAPHR